VADQLLDPAQPRVVRVVVGAHVAAEHEQPVVAGEVVRQLVTGVRAAYVEGAAGVGDPAAEPRRRALVLVLDDEDDRDRLVGTHGTHGAHSCSGTFSSSASQAVAFASLGIRQSPRGDMVPPAATFGPL